jgi:hypothetical protein
LLINRPRFNSSTSTSPCEEPAVTAAAEIGTSCRRSGVGIDAANVHGDTPGGTAGASDRDVDVGGDDGAGKHPKCGEWGPYWQPLTTNDTMITTVT